MEKRTVFALLEGLPDEFDAEELMFRIYLEQKLEAADAQGEAGDVITQEELERQSDAWLG